MPEPGVPAGLVVWRDEPGDSDAEKLALRLAVPLVEQEELPDAEWLLFFEDELLHLHNSRHPEFRPLAVDFMEGDFARRWRSATKNDILVKAIGLKKGVRTVCDATCGLGYDAFLLSTFRELEVTACERSPVVAELVMDALSRVKDTGRFERSPLYFYFGDSRDFLRARPLAFDAVFLDPMFPREEDSGKPRKGMQLLAELVEKVGDGEELFALAWAAAGKRVVVKRADDAPELTKSRAPDYVVAGKTVRYDIYLKL
jgi:16S rRNA (guanine1516-N2)-methyltransferase